MEAKDDYTFIVHATNPVPYAVSLTTHQSLLPLPQKVVEKLGDAWVKKKTTWVTVRISSLTTSLTKNRI